MKALIIIACVIGYLIMWVVMGVIADKDYQEWPSFVGFFWWVSLPLWIVSRLIDYFSSKVSEWKRMKQWKKKQEEAK